jgi:hypothetical protein
MFRFGAVLAALLFGSVFMPAMAQSPTQLAVSTDQGIRLERSGPTRIPLSAAAAFRRPDFEIPPPRGDAQTYLVLQNIFAESPPGIGYDVYLDLPAGRTPPGRGDAHYVGTFHFFDANPSRPREARFNITQKLVTLAAEGLLSKAPSVTVVPGAATQAESRVGSVAIEVR